MSIGSIAKSKVGMMFISSALTVILFVGVFELVKNVKYYRWKADFDNYGWFGKVTIPSPNPVLMWEYRPNGEIDQIKTDSFGFRNSDSDYAVNSHDVFRIAFVGDSVTLGLGVNEEETFVRQFEQLAAREQLPRKVQALNFAVDGYATPQILEMVRVKVLPHSPDSVVYVMCLNDFDFDQSSGKKAKYFRKPPSFFLAELEKVQQRFFQGDFHEFQFNKNRDEVFRSILGMKRLLQDKNVEFQVVVLPIFPEGASSFDGYPIHRIHEELAAFLQDNDIRSLDLREAFAMDGRSPGYFASDAWHPNAAGNRFIAQQLVSSIELE